MSYALGQRVSPLRLAVLISGGGTTLKNLIHKIATGKLDAKIVLVISSSAKPPDCKSPKAAGIPTLVIDPKNSPTAAEFSEATFGPCRESGAEIVAMAGYLKHVLIPLDFENRVTNIHPALIPSCCGPGMYGRRVHEAVLESVAKLSGCTVHLVDNQYDHGPIILQRSVPVLDDDTPDTLAARVFAASARRIPKPANDRPRVSANG